MQSRNRRTDGRVRCGQCPDAAAPSTRCGPCAGRLRLSHPNPAPSAGPCPRQYKLATRTAPAATRTFPLGLDVEVVPGRGHEPLLVARGLAELLERLLRARPTLDDTRQDGHVSKTGNKRHAQPLTFNVLISPSLLAISARSDLYASSKLAWDKKRNHRVMNAVPVGPPESVILPRSGRSAQRRRAAG